MKTIACIIGLIFVTTFLNAQKLVTKNGHVSFYSHTPVEDIEAINNQVVSILDAQTGDIQFSMLIKSFEFKKALMQEHFNENYMESDKIPKASFAGKITNFDKIDLKKDGVYPAKASGEITIHGVTKPLNSEGNITVSGKTVTVKAKFIALPSDYDIKIPAVVEKNIAKELEVNVDVTYTLN